ncbi:MAG: penicillin-binding transpeptidase domain-containing protein [Candidatus Omnitrophica bacterium]|nr:penicillin-binding transpeptidase domain-containing protein [Candidatus Omnitrophota bacterium]
MHSGISKARQLTVFLFFLLILVFLLARLFYLQAIRHKFYSQIASEQHTVSIDLPPKRGTIFDRNMHVLAVNLNCDSVFANPRQIKNKIRTAKIVAPALGLDEKFVLDRISRDKSFIWIKRKITPQEAERVKTLKADGIELIKESKRFYPNKSLASHLIGIVDIDNVGLEGMELYYDKYLKGQGGWLTSAQDARQKMLEYYQDEFVPAKDGFNMVLTIDEVIQNIAERELFKMYNKYNAKAASIVVMDPCSGDVLALANYPNFDLNDYGGRSTESMRNRALNDFYEPGSVFKIVTASAILEENAVKLDDKFDCENGAYKVGSRTLHDHRPHGIMTFKEVIEKSSNIGTVKVAAILGAERLYKYMKAFGFYERTGIRLPGEVVGMNRPISKWTSSSMLAIPMGQEVTATAMQLACAISVIADNGYLVRPRIVKEIMDENGEVIQDFPPKVRRKVISPMTAYRMRQLLMGVVESGTGKKARTAEFKVGGKTGTAQKVEGGLYSHSKFIASFIGFAPVDRPLISVVVSVDEPRPVYFGGDVAAPVFREVVSESLKYLHAKGMKS